MTTRTRPPRTTLPPHLTRHFYETRRDFLRQATGEETTPWFQLTAMERAVVESEMALFRQAIRRAEEEQDLLASLDATTGTAPAAEDTPAAEDSSDESTAAEDCPCPGCSAVAAFLAILERMGKKLEATVRPPETTAEEIERVRQLAKEGLDQWVAAGKPIEVASDSPTPGTTFWMLDVTPAWLTLADLNDDLGQRGYEERTLRHFRQGRPRPPFSPKV